jgi:hypothetical protein
MRTNVSFSYPAEFVSDSYEGSPALSINGAHWFVELLSRVPALHIDENLCQEDWGVVLFVRRNQKKFWIGLSTWSTEGYWLVHFHHGSFAWFQRINSSGKEELKSLLTEFHKVLMSEPAISGVVWYKESEMCKPEPVCYSAPIDG